MVGNDLSVVRNEFKSPALLFQAMERQSVLAAGASACVVVKSGPDAPHIPFSVDIIEYVRVCVCACVGGTHVTVG